MSKKKIKTLLKAKGINAKRIEYMRGDPVPEGFANGWDLDFSDETEDAVFEADNQCGFSTFMQFDNLSDVCEFIDGLPELS